MAQALLDLIIISVTPKEKAVIDKLREEEAQKKRAADLTTEVLMTAANYHRWLVGTGNGDSYSTFCNDFGYDINPSIAIGRDIIHGHVMRVLADVRAASAETVHWSKALE